MKYKEECKGVKDLLFSLQSSPCVLLGTQESGSAEEIRDLKGSTLHKDNRKYSLRAFLGVAGSYYQGLKGTAIK